MMRNLKVLGLALVAMFAMSAVAASMASADEFTSEVSPVTLTGVQEGSDVFTITAGNTTCKEVNYTGTTATPTTTVTATPSYPEKTKATIEPPTEAHQNCTSLGLPATVHTNGCTYLFHIGAGAGVTTGTLDVVCPVGKEITVTAIAAGTTKCTIHVPAQTGLGTVTYANVGAGTTRELKVEAKITNLKYSHKEGTGLGKCTSGTGTAGSYTGKGLITGETDLTKKQEEEGVKPVHVGIFLS